MPAWYELERSQILECGYFSTLSMNIGLRHEMTQPANSAAETWHFWAIFQTFMSLPIMPAWFELEMSQTLECGLEQCAEK